MLRLVFILVLALGLSPLRAAAGEYVLRLASHQPESRAGEAALGAARPAAQRLIALGAIPLRTLGDGLVQPASPRRAVRPTPFDPDPGRTWLVSADSATAERLATDPAVAWIEPHYVREPAVFPLTAPPNDPYFVDTRQWGLWNAGPSGVFRGRERADIHALEAWRLTTGSNELLLAVADTGIDPAHPELQATLPDGRPRLQFPFNATFEPGVGVADSFGHGTPVTGVFAALTNDGPRIDSAGVAGVAGGDGRGNLGCRVVPIRITVGRSGEAGSFDIARAILHATRVGARAMNLSFAGSGASRVEREALHHAITHGCVVVAASGNRGSSAPTAPQYPAAYAAHGLCIQVGASDPQDRRAGFSSYGPGLDLLAPGDRIWTTYMTYPSAAGVSRDGYVLASGTSFAAPHGTGAVGLLAAWRPELMDRDFQFLLRLGADDLGPPGWDAPTGWGRLNAGRSLALIPPTHGVWHDEAPAAVTRVLSRGTLTVGQPGPGHFHQPRTWKDAEVIEVEAVVALPDSFVDSVRVWPRIGGTTTARGELSLPYFVPHAELVAQDAQRFVLRGYVFQVSDASGEYQLPLPLDQARIGFTVIGRVRREPPPLARVRAARVEVRPNPMNGTARFETTGAGPVLLILDVRGRRVRSLDRRGAAWEWDGRDDHGERTPPGIYFARTADGRATARFVRLGEANPSATRFRD